jgi:hypothetical protein
LTAQTKSELRVDKQRDAVVLILDRPQRGNTLTASPVAAMADAVQKAISENVRAGRSLLARSKASLRRAVTAGVESELDIGGVQGRSHWPKLRIAPHDLVIAMARRVI